MGPPMGGMKPIMEIMTINFTLLAMDQIVNHAGQDALHVGRPSSRCPSIVRHGHGRRRPRVAATSLPVLRGMVCLGPGHEGGGPFTLPTISLDCFRSCRDEVDPVLFVEHILLYSTRGPVPAEHYKIPLGKADVKRTGSDVTIVSYSRMVHMALEAAGKLAQEGIEAEVIDLRCLRPLDMETVVESVKKTHNAVVVEKKRGRPGDSPRRWLLQYRSRPSITWTAPIGRSGRCGSSHAILTAFGARPPYPMRTKWAAAVRSIVGS